MTVDFWLVLVVWGSRFSERDINEIARATLNQASGCKQVLLVTDRIRPQVESFVRQELFPTGFSYPEMFTGGYPAKLALLTCPGAPEDMRCVYLDLDTVILGDIGRIAADLRGGEEVLMLPPSLAGSYSFSRFRFWVSQGKSFTKGNSSVLAFRADKGRRLAQEYLAMRADPRNHGLIQCRNDDAFISWAAASNLRWLSKRHAVMFRREFLSRLPGYMHTKNRLPWCKKRRNGLVAITFNGLDFAPKKILSLPDGTLLRDSKGRRGIWSGEEIGPVKELVISYCKRVS